MFESEIYPGQFETDVLAFTDPRTKYNGIRVLCNEESFDLSDDLKVYKNSSEYDLVRMILGIPESSSELGS